MPWAEHIYEGVRMPCSSVTSNLERRCQWRSFPLADGADGAKFLAPPTNTGLEVMELLAQCLTECKPVYVDHRACIRIEELVPGYSALGSNAKSACRTKLVSALRRLGQRQPGCPRRTDTFGRRVSGKFQGMLVVGPWAADGGKSNLEALQQRAVKCLNWAAQPVQVELPRAKRPRNGAAFVCADTVICPVQLRSAANNCACTAQAL